MIGNTNAVLPLNNKFVYKERPFGSRSLALELTAPASLLDTRYRADTGSASYTH